jgi:Trp operon repressor
MTTLDTKQMVYYRPNTSETELLTASDVKRLHKAWGNNQPYNHMGTMEEDQNYGTGLHIVTELMSVIQCDRKLNERQQALEARITKGLTRSKAYGSDYVESNLLYDLVQDAKAQFLKDGGDLREAFGIEENDPKRIYSHYTPMKEFKRLFGIPYKSVMDEVKKCEEQIGDIPAATTKHKIKYEVSHDQCSCYKHYHIKGKLSIDMTYNENELMPQIYKKFPYLGKLHQSMFGEDNIQVYLYDYHLSNNGLQNVVDYLLRRKKLTLL